MRSWLASWRLAARIARRDARRYKGRTLLILAMLMLPAMAGAVALVVADSAQASPQTKVSQTLGAAAQARITWNVPSCALEQTADAAEQACADPAAPDLTGLGPRELAGVLGAGADLVTGSRQSVNLVADDRAIPLSDVTQIDAGTLTGIVSASSGRLPARAGEVLLDPAAASDLAVGVGDTVTLRTDLGQDITAKVSGLGGTGGDSKAITAPGTLPDADGQATQYVSYVLGAKDITWATVRELNARGYVAFSRAVVLDPPADAPRPGSITPGDGLGGSVGILAGFAGLGVLEIALIIGPAFAVGAQRSRRSLALLASTGATPADTSRVVRAAGLGLGAIAGVAGVVVGGGGASAVISRLVGSPELPNLRVPWPLLLAVAAGTALLGMLAAWLPGRAIARLDPAAAMRESPEAASRKAPVPWPGLAVLATGGGLAAYGAASGDTSLTMAGGLLALVGVVLLAGTLVWLTARIAPATGVPARLALRDAVRHRSRTAPALAAVLACVAGGTLTLGYTVTFQNAANSTLHATLGDGRISLADNASGAVTGEQALRRVIGRASSIAPMSASLPVRVVDGGERAATVEPVCPGFTPTETDFAPGPCIPQVTGYSSFGGDWGARDFQSPNIVIVDDGTVTAQTGLPGAKQAASALKAGMVLVNDRGLIDANGEVSVRGRVWAKGGSRDAAASDKTLHLPARYVPWRAHLYQLVIPPPVATQLGVGTWLSGYLLVPAHELTGQQEAQLNGLSATDPGIVLRVSAPPEPPPPALLLVLCAVAALIAAAATWIAVGLARAQTRSDMATLAAVGAAPSTRRRFAGAQAAVIAVVGAVVGTAIGLGLVWVAVQALAQNSSDGSIVAMSVPWLPQLVLLAGVPAVAVVGAMLATRSRLPSLTRRFT